ncbi:MAG: hypothetical protein IPK97_09095 [Ahniella sp.]|nr:hypothetical protein [Ahniella sp.]
MSIGFAPDSPSRAAESEATVEADHAEWGIREVVASESTSPSSSVDKLPAEVRTVILSLLNVPMKHSEVASALNVSTGKARAWLQHLVDEGTIEQRRKPAGYIVKQSSLF